MTSEQANLELLLFRVEALEEGQREFSKRVDRQFEQLTAAVNALAFVPMALYMSERDSLKKDIAGAYDQADDARKMALAAFGTIASAIIGAIIIAVVAVVR